MIGLAAVVLMATHGKVMGISGIFGGAMSAQGNERKWRLLFIAGVVLGPILVFLFGGKTPSLVLTENLLLLVVAGFLVGFGTKIGNGCTTGHGVCGIARLSPRSLVATGTFLGMAMVAVFIIRLFAGAS